MAHLVEVDSKGTITYEGLLTSKDRVPFDELVETLKKEIPEIENELKEKYGVSIDYKYYLGKFLAEILQKNKISNAERRKFWDEIKYLASSETRTRSEGTNAKTRSFFEQCYVLSLIDYAVVKKMSWRQWQDLLDRIDNRDDERIYLWIGSKKEKIKEENWREFEKALHLYLSTRDTSVFSNDEMFIIYDSLYGMGEFWLSAIRQFSKEYPKSLKLKNKASWSKKFYSGCFAKRKLEHRELSKEDYVFLFQQLMYPKNDNS